MDVVLHLHPASEAPAPSLEQLIGDPERSPARFAGGARQSVPVLLVYTKGDLIPREQRDRLARSGLVVSVTKGQGLDLLLERIRALLPEAPFEHDPEDVSAQPLRFFVVEYLREAAFALLADELPYAFTAEVEEFREAQRPIYIRVTLFVERESQKRIVVGRGGQTLKAIGAHARARLEELIGSPVYLDTWVKVLPRWRRSPTALARFGFPEPTRDLGTSPSPRREPA